MPRGAAKQDKIIFLDRDGVINYDSGIGEYITSAASFKFYPGSLKALKKLSAAGFKIIVISNQAGIAKGLYTQKDLDGITAKMQKGVKEIGAKLHSVNYCPHETADDCDCRKPKIGMITRAAKDLKFDWSNTFFIGDNRRDVLAAKAAGLKSIFVASGNTKLHELDVPADYAADNLLEAVEKIVLTG